MDNLFGKEDSENESEHVELDDKDEKFNISQNSSTSKDIENMDIDVLPIKVNYYIVVWLYNVRYKLMESIRYDRYIYLRENWTL